MKAFDKCPICGDCGEDLLFAFYCYNKKCQNYSKHVEKPMNNGNKKEFEGMDISSDYGDFTHWPFNDDDDD